jgi:hypothetical protein
MDFGACHGKSTPAAEPNYDGGPPLMPSDRPQYRICPHPGELVRRVKTTHLTSVNADSTAGERRVSDRERRVVRTRSGAPRGRCNRNRVHWRNPLAVHAYGVLDRLRDLAVWLVSVQPQPAADRRPTTRRRIDIHTRRRHAGDRLPRVANRSIWRFTEMTQPHDWT